MSNVEKLRSKLEAIKDLKAEYYIGSLAAFSYLKERRWLEKTREEVISRLNPQQRQSPLIANLSLKQIDWLVEAICLVVSSVLQRVTILASTPADWSLETEHRVILPCKNENEEKKYADKLIGLWIINDCPAALATILKELGKHQSWPKAGRLFRAVAEKVNASLKSGTLRITYVATGEAITLAEFSGQARFRQCPVGWVKHAIENLLHFERMHLVDLTSEEKGILETALKTAEYDLAHDILKREGSNLSDSERGARAHMVKEEWANDLIGADKRWLYDGELYERAEREYTLGYLGIERRVALTAVRTSGDDSTPAELRVNNFLERQKKWFVTQQKLLAEYKNPLAAEPMNDNYRFLCRELSRLERKRRYEYLAVLQNKKWLIDFLSR